MPAQGTRATGEVEAAWACGWASMLLAGTGCCEQESFTVQLQGPPEGQLASPGRRPAAQRKEKIYPGVGGQGLLEPGSARGGVAAGGHW